MGDWGWDQWMRFTLTWAAIFAIGGGIISQTTEGVSGRGFVEGMWKGIEWFFIVVVGIGILWLAWMGLMQLSSSLNA